MIMKRFKTKPCTLPTIPFSCLFRLFSREQQHSAVEIETPPSQMSMELHILASPMLSGYTQPVHNSLRLSNLSSVNKCNLLLVGSVPLNDNWRCQALTNAIFQPQGGVSPPLSFSLIKRWHRFRRPHRSDILHTSCRVFTYAST